MDTPSFKEDHISQVPALQLLINLGYIYFSTEEALIARGGKTSLFASRFQYARRYFDAIESEGRSYLAHSGER